MQKLKDMSPTEKSVVLLTYTRQERGITTTRKNISDILGLHPQTVRELLPKMRRAGVLEEVKGTQGNVVEILIDLTEILS